MTRAARVHRGSSFDIAVAYEFFNNLLDERERLPAIDAAMDHIGALQRRPRHAGVWWP